MQLLADRTWAFIARQTALCQSQHLIRPCCCALLGLALGGMPTVKFKEALKLQKVLLRLLLTSVLSKVLSYTYELKTGRGQWG